jgi:hypothetical protein
MDESLIRRVVVEIPIRTVEEPAAGSEDSMLVIEKYGLEVVFEDVEGGTGKWVLDRPIVEMYLEPEFGETYMALDDEEAVAAVRRGEKPATWLLRNVVLDPGLRPRDPHHRVKIMAAVADALDRIRLATGIASLDFYELWFSGAGRPRWRRVLTEEAMGETRRAAREVEFSVSVHIPTLISGALS